LPKKVRVNDLGPVDIDAAAAAVLPPVRPAAQPHPRTAPHATPLPGMVGWPLTAAGPLSGQHAQPAPPVPPNPYARPGTPTTPMRPSPLSPLPAAPGSAPQMPVPPPRRSDRSSGATLAPATVIGVGVPISSEHPVLGPGAVSVARDRLGVPRTPSAPQPILPTYHDPAVYPPVHGDATVIDTFVPHGQPVPDARTVERLRSNSDMLPKLVVSPPRPADSQPVPCPTPTPKPTPRPESPAAWPPGVPRGLADRYGKCR
jgi:hypothetical protein